jgi:hypothetical protein
MMEAVRVLVPQVVTVAAINTQIATLNTVYGSNVAPLPPRSVINAWNVELLRLPRPSIGYDIGWNKDGTAKLQHNGLEKMTIPVWFYVIGPANKDKDASLQAVGIMFEALLRVIDPFPPNGMEQQTMTGVTPVRAIALVNAAQTRTFTLDSEAAVAVPGIASSWDFEVYVATS